MVRRLTLNQLIEVRFLAPEPIQEWIMIEVYDNAIAGGDWVVVKVDGRVVFANHSFDHRDMIRMMEAARIPVIYRSVSDEEIEII